MNCLVTELQMGNQPKQEFCMNGSVTASAWLLHEKIICGFRGILVVWRLVVSQESSWSQNEQNNKVGPEEKGVVHYGCKEANVSMLHNLKIICMWAVDTTASCVTNKNFQILCNIFIHLSHFSSSHCVICKKKSIPLPFLDSWLHTWTGQYLLSEADPRIKAINLRSMVRLNSLIRIFYLKKKPCSMDQYTNLFPMNEAWT